MKIKINPSELRKKSIDELEEIKKQLKEFLLNKKLYVSKRDKGLSPRELKRNIARINTILRERDGRLSK